MEGSTPTHWCRLNYDPRLSPYFVPFCHQQFSPEKGEDFIGQTITIKGWVRTARKQKTFAFVEVSLYHPSQVMYPERRPEHVSLGATA